MPARVLVSNDDGIDAPGLRALVSALSKLEGVEVYVCAPSGERSAQSHAVSLRRHLACHPHKGVDGAKAAFAVDGGPRAARAPPRAKPPRTDACGGRGQAPRAPPFSHGRRRAAPRGALGPHHRSVTCG